VAAVTDLTPQRITERYLREQVDAERARNRNLIGLLWDATKPATAPDWSQLSTMARDDFAASIRTRLEKLRKKVAEDGIIASTVQLTGLPVVLILREADALRADYIVMGSHGHNALYDLVVGSTASGVMKSAGCPVLIVSSPRKPPRKGRG